MDFGLLQSAVILLNSNNEELRLSNDVELSLKVCLAEGTGNDVYIAHL